MLPRASVAGLSVSLLQGDQMPMVTGQLQHMGRIQSSSEACGDAQRVCVCVPSTGGLGFQFPRRLPK